MMKYQELWNEENTQVMERYDLSMERIGLFQKEDQVKEPFRDYFCTMGDFVKQVEQQVRRCLRDEIEGLSLEELQLLNQELFQDLQPESYESSYANPTYAANCLGEEMGPLLSAFYAQLRAAIVFAQECRLFDITILCETLIELYNLFELEEGTPAPQQVKQVLYFFHRDYTDRMLTYRIREQLDPSLTFAKDLILEHDLEDLRYLYFYGEYISKTELEVAAFLNNLPEETIVCMAASCTEGYRKGFERAKIDLFQKKNVGVRYAIGFERMVKEVIRQLEAMGLTSILYRTPSWSISQTPGRKVGYFATPVNRQYEYDHRYDNGIYLDKAFQERKLSVLKSAYQVYEKEAADYAGPILIETFGEDGFEPVNQKAAIGLTKKQEELTISYSNDSMPVVNQYIPADQTSFTIIAFPIPAIGPDFPEIFQETIRINTLDYEKYQLIQQNLIDVLDQARYVTVTGRGGNETNLRIVLHPLVDPSRQSNFENCVADVNIPVGEVFTSPVLAGTEGLLHVGSVYIWDYQFQNLKIWFQDGMITDYSCDNFEDPKEGKALIRQQILKNQDTLAMGEFAIGTNTAAYAMAQKYNIAKKLPILIAEKMGPHFAVGDTCYSWSEDMAVYNPDGKELIARDNEKSILRKKDVSKAYFGCHTDITIPYSELGDIVAVRADQTECPVILGGKFVVAGTEELNEDLMG